MNAERSVWVVWATPAAHSDQLAWLDDDEAARLAQLRQGADRDRMATSRRLLKTLVAQVAEVDPADVRLHYPCPDCDKPHGRPEVVAPEVAQALHVTLSHSGRRVVVAVSTAGPIGVDVEPEESADFAGFDEVALATTERAEIVRLRYSDRRRGRTRYWVRKEAVLKALGCGLRLAPSSVAVTAPHAAPAVLRVPKSVHEGDHECSDGLDPADLGLHDLDVGHGFACTLAVQSPEPALVHVLPATDRRQTPR